MKQARRNTGMKRRDFLKASLAGAATALSAGFGAPAIGQVPKTLRFGHMLPTTQTQSRAVVMFGDELAKLSGNKFKVEVFPSSQLGSIAEMMQSVQAGSLSMSMAVPAWYSSFAKPLDAFTLPYLVVPTSCVPRSTAPLAARSQYCEGAG
jgi:C4-dicarboxylate-binding protein DctP